MGAASGPATAFATLAALRYREATGRGQLVEVDQSENILNHLGDIFVDCQLGVEAQRWADVAGRQAHHDELDAVIGEWAADQTADTAFHVLQRAGVAAAPILDDEPFARAPHSKDRQWQRPLLSLDVGPPLHPGYPSRGVPREWRRGSPVL